MKKFAFLTLILCAASLAATAAGIDGKWVSESKRGENTIQQTLTLKSDGGAPIGAYVTLSGDRADHDFVRVNVLWKVRQVPNSSEQGHAEKPGDYGYFPGWPTDRTQCTRRRIYRARAEESRAEQQAHARQP